MQKNLSVKETKNHFDTVLREVSSGTQVVVEEDGRPLAVILSVEAYKLMLKLPLQTRSQDELAASAFGMWADRDDIDDEWLGKVRKNWENNWVDE